MLKRLFALTVTGIVLGLAAAANAQTAPQPSATTRYEKFLKRTDVVIVTQRHSLPNPGGFRISAVVAWALGETQKVYAADIGDKIVDFDQLAVIQDGLDKMIQAVNISFDTLHASSMIYSSPSGVSANYYSYVLDGQPKRNLYLMVGTGSFQSPNIEALTQLRDSIAQARQRLVSLGAR